MDLFAGLENLGISGIDSASLFSEEEVKKDTQEEQEADVPQTEPEESMIYDKTYECPVCDKSFKSKAVRGNKAKLLGTDMDLRPVYGNVDALKYEVVACPHCGYAALTRYFGPMASVHVKMIRQGISDHFIPKDNTDTSYSYETAIERYRLALANAMVKKAKASEKAYICLKTAWVLRGMADMKEAAGEEFQAIHDEEDIFLKNAYEGLLKARQSESPPICGMDSSTLDYLIAVLALRFSYYEVCAKMISGLLVNKTVSNRIKDKARELKDQLRTELKNKE